MVLGLACQAADQFGAFDNQVRLLQRNHGGAAVGEQLKAFDFVDDSALADRAQQAAHAVGHDQRAGNWVYLFGALENADGAALGEPAGRR